MSNVTAMEKRIPKSNGGNIKLRLKMSVSNPSCLTAEK